MFLPEFDREYLSEKGLNFEEKNSGGKGLIIRNLILPEGKYNHHSSDLLILIPQGYPEVKPDMWYFYPSILLAPDNHPAKQTQASIKILKERIGNVGQGIILLMSGVVE